MNNIVFKTKELSIKKENKILITGGAGFIGHHLIEKLLSTTSCNIISLDRLDTSGNLSRIEHVLQLNPAWKKRIKLVWHDLKAPLNQMVRKSIGEGITHVLHLAAGSHVDRSIENPMEFVYDNVVGTGNILEYCRLHLKDSLEFFLYFSTDEVFGPAPDGVIYKEDDRYRCNNPYAATKAGAEELCVAFENTYKMPIIISHTMNVFGNRQHPEKFIPKVIGNIIEGKKTFIHADETCTIPGSRHYIHSEDVADAVLFLMQNHTVGEKYNIVGKEEVNNLELAEMIAQILDCDLDYELIDFHSVRPGHDLRYAISGVKMKKLGWEPSRILRDSLQEVITWTLQYPEWYEI